ncbi:MAG: carotenoid oxygenase family protein [Gammaproteobacteria bacterium]|nr:carotenoid oxygenase family protein [Gammaproteobacteria bacterium]
MLNRRDLLVLGGAGSLCGLMAPSRATTSDTTYESFHKNLPLKPWLRLYEGIRDADTGLTQCAIEGDWPPDLVGALFRNGPGRMERAGRRYQHWFDGDGLIQKWSIEPGAKVTHHARLVHTTKYLRDESNNELSLIGFGTAGDHSIDITGPDSLNVGNINVLARDDELWALWEGGSAWRVEPESLKTTGIVELSTESAGLPFSAHPRVEPNGTIWNFGYVSHLGALVIWRLDPGVKAPKISIVQRSPMTIPHDFVVTDRHLVIPLPPLHYEPNRAVEQTFIDMHVWHSNGSLDLLVMDKNDLERNFIVELPAHWLFHYSNAWEDKEGVIRFEGFRYDDPSLMTAAFSAVMRGELPQSLSLSQLVQFRVDTRKRRADVEVFDNGFAACEFPSIDQRRSTSRHEWLTMLVNDSASNSALQLGLLNGVARVNTSTGEMSRFTYPEREIPEEHIFVADPKGIDETEGWILGTSLDYVADETHLNVFEIGDTTPEPIARATLARLMPIGLHGQFVAAT